MMARLSWVVGVLAVGACVTAPLAGAADFGVKGGLARSSNGSGQVFAAGNGFQVGCFAGIATFKGFQIQPEVLFVRRVTVARLGDGIATIRSTTSLDYIEVPVLLKRTFRRGRSLTPMLVAGAFGALRTRAVARHEIGDASYSDDAKSQVRSGDFGVVGGAGLEIAVLRHAWIAEIRYTHGLTRVETGTSDGRWKTRTLGVMGGIRW
jgi:hypothetical protein